MHRIIYICSSPKMHTAKDKVHQRCSIPGLQITPSPSFPPQLSLVSWGQSKSFSSVPLHLTSSIIKSSETLPKCDSLVYCPPLYPSSLGNFSNCYGKLLWEKCRWLFWAKRKWTCKQLGRLLWDIFQNHRHRQASLQPWCSLPAHFFHQQALYVLEKKQKCMLIQPNYHFYILNVFRCASISSTYPHTSIRFT